MGSRHSSLSLIVVTPNTLLLEITDGKKQSVTPVSLL